MLVTIDQARKDIEAGKVLSLAADEELLKKLPQGTWIGGTIPYFMDTRGGKTTKEMVFVNEMPSFAAKPKIAWYDEGNISSVTNDAYENGATFLIIPASSPAHITFARNAPNFKDIFLKPIIGWISGVLLADLGKITPKVFDGATGKSSDAKAIALHLELPAGKLASIGIVNLFTPGAGDTITFDTEGFSVTQCNVNGAKTDFADYLVSKRIDTKLPLVANYCGTMVNVSFQAVDEKKKTVALYAPVFRGVEYKIASPVGDYVKEFTSRIPAGKIDPVFSCNCILNYLYSELEGKSTGSITGPITFGEIAYQLLNQTLVYMQIDEVS